ncbi:prenyltransferase [Marinobacter arenosus]|uniref:prenyltransferase n=1 Tax=Marinobacter arenosus TaxID=2856822 RepID=UPI001C4AD7DC|nr:prenyltransferase [Marinobacter arenosus]MBW0147961.1 prenyltransferase [Marinobacter arenosus]
MSETGAIVRASRPNFLILAPLCAGLGMAIASHQGVQTAVLDVVLVFLGAVLAHAAVNLFNEHQDFVSGLDLITRRTPFSGGSGALPEAPSAATGVLATAVTTLGLVIAIGGYFVWQRGVPMLMVGVAGLLLILTYTRWITRSPLLCLLAPGLGFGPVMVLGTVIALGARIDTTTLVVSLISLFLASELLLINQIPDADADRTVGRRHLVITCGPRAAARLVAALLAGSQLILLTGWWLGWLPTGTALALLSAPLMLWIGLNLPQALTRPKRLNLILGANVVGLLATLALLVIGLLV